MYHTCTPSKYIDDLISGGVICTVQYTYGLCEVALVELCEVALVQGCLYFSGSIGVHCNTLSLVIHCYISHLSS